MVEYERPVDYSMPRQCGLYPPPPYTYPKMRSLVALFEISMDEKAKYLPNEFKPMNLFDAVFILEYPDSSIGPYNENLILLSCTYNNSPGLYVFNIYVDSDIAMAAGREIWGYCKKMCTIELSDIEENTVRGSLTRMGSTFLEAEIELTDRPPGLKIEDLIGSMPIYNLKLIPNVDGSKNYALRQVTQTILKIDAIHKTLGAKTNYIKSTYSKFDICDELLKNAKTDLGGFYIEADMVLPPGNVLE